jgi:hypothetical protein
VKKVVYVSVADLKSEELKRRSFERIADSLETYFHVGLWNSFNVHIEFSAKELSQFNANAITSLIGQAILETCLNHNFHIALTTDIKEKVNGSVIVTITIVEAALYIEPKISIGLN